MKKLTEITNEELLKELRDKWVTIYEPDMMPKYNILECEILNRMNGCKPKESD